LISDLVIMQSLIIFHKFHVLNKLCRLPPISAATRGELSSFTNSNGIRNRLLLNTSCFPICAHSFFWPSVYVSEIHVLYRLCMWSVWAVSLFSLNKTRAVSLSASEMDPVSAHVSLLESVCRVSRRRGGVQTSEWCPTASDAGAGRREQRHPRVHWLTAPDPSVCPGYWSLCRPALAEFFLSLGQYGFIYLFVLRHADLFHRGD
jgi:hypothetical protein